MKIFSSLYEKVLRWSSHEHAPRYLGVLSFAESSFFPVPPDVMLAPMVIAKREMAWRYAALTTIASVLGGIAGYLIGMFLFAELGQPMIDFYNAQAKFAQVKTWFDHYGIWIVFIAGFSPIPYKVFTITSGVLTLAWLPFVLASLIGRGARFFLVAGLLYWGGEKFSQFLHRRIDQIGWAVVAVIILVVVILQVY